MKLAVIEHELVQARPTFELLSPGPLQALRGSAANMAKAAFGVMAAAKVARQVRKRESSLGDISADLIASAVVGKATRVALKRPRKAITDVHLHVQSVGKRDLFRKNGMGGRSWITTPGTYDLVIIFHDANKAGPHIDIHVGRFSMIRRVKPEVYAQLRYNNDGLLTADSRERLMAMLREDIANNSRIPQNLDHSKNNARASWVGGDPGSQWYGAGRTRQIVVQDSAYVFKARHDVGAPFEFYAPAINPHRGMYVHRLYNGSDTRAPILVWGNLKSDPPALHDRLHLTLTHPEAIGTLDTRVDPSTSTAKLDGSSCYFVITKKGTHVYSPRQSKRTGSQIEYTFKVPGVAETYAEPLVDFFTTDPDYVLDGTIVGMGELMFRRSNRFFWQRDSYLPQAQAGGLLNAQAVVPKGYKPEIFIYRIDKIGNRKLVDLPFEQNRELQEQTASLNPEVFKVVPKMGYHEAVARGFEGVVVAPVGGSVNDAYKVKAWNADLDDWLLEEVGFTHGDKGGIAGVCTFTSLQSGKTFRMGPGQMGTRDNALAMMADPQEYVGRVAKVKSRTGHEGRAAVFTEWHDAKGLG